MDAVLKRPQSPISDHNDDGKLDGVNEVDNLDKLDYVTLPCHRPLLQKQAIGA